MLSTLFLQDVNKYWILGRVRQPINMVLPSDQDKLSRAMVALDKAAKDLDQPNQFVVSAYAYFYVDVFRMTSLNMVYLKASEFLAKIQLDKLPKFTGDDTELAYKLRTVWVKMNHIKSNDLPFKVRSFVSKQRVVIGVNTFFTKSYDFVKFTLIAHFINQNKLNYPEMHGISELMIHLPALNGPGEYCPAQYVNCEKTLDRYYKLVYKSTVPKEKRYQHLIKLTPESQIEHLKRGLWCSSQVKKDFAEVVNAGN